MSELIDGSAKKVKLAEKSFNTSQASSKTLQISVLKTLSGTFGNTVFISWSGKK